MTALVMYRKHIFQEHLDRLWSAIFDEIKKDREGEIVDHSLVKKAIMQFIYVDLHEKTGDHPQKVVIEKVKDSNVLTEFEWTGARSLSVYDEKFEAPLMDMASDFFR